MLKRSFVLRLACNDRPGIVAAFSGALQRVGGNITDAQQFNDISSGRFFARVVFDVDRSTPEAEAMEARMAEALRHFNPAWSIRDIAKLQRVMVFASRSDHCLADTLYRWRTGEIAMDLVGIVSNHPRETYAHLRLPEIPFHYFPRDRENKLAQEEKIAALLDAQKVDLVVLARYMQILSDQFVSSMLGRCINIHHSFLPGFKGARPYHQAHQRGVKLIGATAHYVTAELDEGPIIEQDVERISHYDEPVDLIRKGRDIERRFWRGRYVTIWRTVYFLTVRRRSYFRAEATGAGQRGQTTRGAARGSADEGGKDPAV